MNAPHGTVSAYIHRRCRCPECQDARRAYYGQRPREVVDAERAAEHGTESKYSAGCRCDACRRAATDARKRRRHSDPEHTRAYEREHRRQRRTAAA